jgi:hypothetical protein
MVNAGQAAIGRRLFTTASLLSRARSATICSATPQENSIIIGTPIGVLKSVDVS